MIHSDDHAPDNTPPSFMTDFVDHAHRDETYPQEKTPSGVLKGTSLACFVAHMEKYPPSRMLEIVEEPGQSIDKRASSNSLSVINQGLDYGKAKVSRREDVQPLSLNKDRLTRKYQKRTKVRDVVPSMNAVERADTTCAGKSRQSVSFVSPQFKDTEDTDPDNLLHCPECGAKWGGNCPLHGFLHCVSDVVVPLHTSNTLRADLTTPYVVNVNTLLNGEMGVSARLPIPIRTRFGPYEGEKVAPEIASEHAWLIRKDGKPNHCIDALEPGLSNWMRYVQHGQKGTENLLAYQHHGKIYYMTIRNILPGEVLLVWCGSKYKQLQESVSSESHWTQVQGKSEKSIKKEMIEEFIGDMDIKREIVCEPLNLIKTDDKNEDDKYIKHEASFEEISSDKIIRRRQDLIRNYEEITVEENGGVSHESMAGETSVEIEVDKDLFLDDVGEHFGNGSRRGTVPDVPGYANRVLCEDAKKDQSENSRQDLKQQMSRNIKMEASQDDTPSIKEEVPDVSESSLIEEVIGSGTEGVHGLQESGCQDLMEFGSVDPSLGDNRNTTDACRVDEILSRRHALCDAATPGTAAAMEEADEEETVSTVGVSSNEVSSGKLAQVQPQLIFTCADCDISFSLKSELDIHSKIHLGDKPFVCEVCKKNFDCETSLTQHRRVHSGKMASPYECSRRLALGGKDKNRMLSRSNLAAFTCSERQCNARFSTRTGYHKHLEKHKTQKAVNCLKCLKELASEESLNVHLRRTICSYLPYTCSKCRTAFVESEKFKEHSCVEATSQEKCQDRHSERPYLCSECNLNYDCKAKLHDHYRASHKPLHSVFCDYCKKQYSSCSVLQKHVRRVHSKEKPHVCRVCNKRFFSSRELQRHLPTHSKTYPCLTCHRYFGSKKEFIRHSLSIHQTFPEQSHPKHSRMRLFKCADCEEQFLLHSEYDKHVQNHSRDKLFIDQGDNALADSELQRTLTLDKNLECILTERRNNLFCSNCEKEFFDKETLFDHVCTRLSRVGPYECNKCGKKCISSSDLERHMIGHREVRSYLCLECNSDFVSQSQLDEHQCTDNERPFACSECDRRFWSETAYKTHFNSHDKLHICSECSESFSRFELLEAHVQIHSKEEPVSCSECNPDWYKKFCLSSGSHFQTRNNESETFLTCAHCDKKIFDENSLPEHLSQDPRPFEFVSCEPE